MVESKASGLASEPYLPTGNLARDIVAAPTQGHLHESVAWIFAGFGAAAAVVEAVWLQFRAEVGGHVGLILLVVIIVCGAAGAYFGVRARIDHANNRKRQEADIAKAIEDARSECRAEYASDWTASNPLGPLLNPIAAVCTLSKDIVRINTIVANAYHLARDLRRFPGAVMNGTDKRAEPAYSEDVMKELVLHVANRCHRDEHYGVLKLNKILFYADFAAYKRRGRPITGAVYRKYTHGPAPAIMKHLRQEMEREKDVYEYTDPSPPVNADGDVMAEKRLLPMRRPKLDKLTAEEIAIVDEVIAWLRPLTGKAVSLLSHHHPGWRIPEMEQDIPYFAALLPEEPEVLSAADLHWARGVAARYEAGVVSP